MPISVQRRVARPIICSYKILDFTARKKTKLQISGTSIPVVKRSTVTTIFGYFSFLNLFVSPEGSLILPVIFLIASWCTSIPIFSNSSYKIRTTSSACESRAANIKVFSSPSGSSSFTSSAKTVWLNDGVNTFLLNLSTSRWISSSIFANFSILLVSGS